MIAQFHRRLSRHLLSARVFRNQALLSSQATKPRTAFVSSSAQTKKPVVNSHNEWDPLEEVIVGTVRGAHFFSAHETPIKAVLSFHDKQIISKLSAKPQPADLVKAAEKELDYLCQVLRAEGVTVKRPEVQGLDGDEDISRPYKTPDFEAPCGLDSAMVRDNLLILGDTIVEAPMSWRSRFFEYRHFRKLIKGYFEAGAKWMPAPKPMMSDDLYSPNWTLKIPPREDSLALKDQVEYDMPITEFEPVFEAADFMRFGRDIFYQLSFGTNQFGVEWMKRTFPEYRFHRVSLSNDPTPFHIDMGFIPLGPGKLMINGEYPPNCGGPNGKNSWFEFDGKPGRYNIPAMFKGWDVFVCPKPSYPKEMLRFSTVWIAATNVLMLDKERVFVESNEPGIIDKFSSWGFKPIPIPFRNVMMLGGGAFHCVTCDIRRSSKLESYF